MRKYLSLFAVALLLAACESTSTETEATDSTGGTDQTMTDNTGATTADTGDTATQGTMGGIQPGSPDDFKTNVGDRVFFDYDSYTLTGTAQQRLQNQYAWLSNYPGIPFTIEGHCDERGTREYNLALGERRANAVFEYFMSLGINAGRMDTISYGKERPAVEGSNEAAWAQNRRAVVVLKP